MIAIIAENGTPDSTGRPFPTKTESNETSIHTRLIVFTYQTLNYNEPKKYIDYTNKD